MDPITIALLVASAAATAGGLSASASQFRLDIATITAETEAAKLQATEQALSQAQSFTQALASQLALSAMREGAGGSLVRQFGAESVSNMLADQRSFSRQQSFIDISSQLSRAGARTARFKRNVSSLSSLFSQGLGSVNASGGS